MQVVQHVWANRQWCFSSGELGDTAPGRSVIFLAGAPEQLIDGSALDALRARHPDVPILAVSAAGEIAGTRLLDGSLVATVLSFARAHVRGAVVAIGAVGRSREAGAEVARSLSGDALKHVLVFCEGVEVNGSELVLGMTAALPSGVTISGGLASDGSRDQQTLTSFDGPPRRGQVAAVGFYGAGLRVACGTAGGWDAFGPERLVTRSDGGTVYEIDGEPALALYKRYLGPHAVGLPASALRFPLALRGEERGCEIVRTVIAVGEDDERLVFAGDVPEGAHVRMMKSSPDRLVDGAALAAEAGRAEAASVAILVSCVGRRWMLGQRTEEELEIVRDVLGEGVRLAGFYSNGEIAPCRPGAKVGLHNQTMTVTTFAEDT